MPKFRSKPNVVEAVQVTESMFLGDHPNPEHVTGVIYLPEAKMVQIKTLHGNSFAGIGDWIVSGTCGEKYPVRDDIFQKDYELVEDDIGPAPGAQG